MSQEPVKTYLVTESTLAEFQAAIIELERAKHVGALKDEAARKLKKVQQRLLAKPVSWKEVSPAVK